MIQGLLVGGLASHGGGGARWAVTGCDGHTFVPPGRVTRELVNSLARQSREARPLCHISVAFRGDRLS